MNISSFSGTSGNVHFFYGINSTTNKEIMKIKKIAVEMTETDYNALDFALMEMESQLFNRLAGKEGGMKDLKYKLQKLLEETIDIRNKLGNAWRDDN